MANNKNNQNPNANTGISPEAAALGAASINALGGLALDAAKNKKQWKYQQKAMDKQWQLNQEAWNLQNSYNTPQAQMERLQQAGLNPRLIYGSGSSAPNMASPVDAPTVPVRQAAGAQVPDLLQYYQVRQMDAQYQNTIMATDLMEKKGALSEIQMGLKNLELFKENIRSKNYSGVVQMEQAMQRWIALRSQQLLINEGKRGTNLTKEGFLLDKKNTLTGKQSEMLDVQKSNEELRTGVLGQSISNMQRQGQLMDQLGTMRAKQITSQDLDNAFKTHRNELARFGIYSSDHAALRSLIAFSRRVGMDFDELMKMGVDKIKSIFE